MGKENRLRLHIGCGNVYKKGYVNIDAYNTEVADLKAFAHRLPYSDNTVELIECYHLLEHLNDDQLHKVFNEWFRVLKPEGKLIIEVPNLVRNMEVFLNSDYSERWGEIYGNIQIPRIKSIFGLGSNDGQLHKTGFDKKRLCNLLIYHGFKTIKLSDKRGTPVKGENIVAVCVKSKKRRNKEVIKKLELATMAKRGFFHKFLHSIKGRLVYLLRYLADFIDEIKFFR